MGLDQYAYIAGRAGQRAAWHEKAKWDPKRQEFVNDEVSEPREICYWRKHPNLQGWMKNLYLSKGGTDEFNGDEVELTWDDIDKLEKDIKRGHVAELETTGFFFGDPSDDFYKEHDLEFCANAKAELFLGLKVFYNSSW
jgi:hypothetical protein